MEEVPTPPLQKGDCAAAWGAGRAGGGWVKHSVVPAAGGAGLEGAVLPRGGGQAGLHLAGSPWAPRQRRLPVAPLCPMASALGGSLAPAASVWLSQDPALGACRGRAGLGARAQGKSGVLAEGGGDHWVRVGARVSATLGDFPFSPCCLSSLGTWVTRGWVTSCLMLREGAGLCLPPCPGGPSTQRGTGEEEGTAGRAAPPAARGLFSHSAWRNASDLVSFQTPFCLMNQTLALWGMS